MANNRSVAAQAASAAARAAPTAPAGTSATRLGFNLNVLRQQGERDGAWLRANCPLLFDPRPHDSDIRQLPRLSLMRDQNGHPVWLNRHDHIRNEIRSTRADVPHIPADLGDNEHWYVYEVIRRMDPRTNMTDIVDRVNENLPSGSKALHTNSLQMRLSRGRKSLARRYHMTPSNWDKAFRTAASKRPQGERTEQGWVLNGPGGNNTSIQQVPTNPAPGGASSSGQLQTNNANDARDSRGTKRRRERDEAESTEENDNDSPEGFRPSKVARGASSEPEEEMTQEGPTNSEFQRAFREEEYEQNPYWLISNADDAELSSQESNRGTAAYNVEESPEEITGGNFNEDNLDPELMGPGALPVNNPLIREAPHTVQASQQNAAAMAEESPESSKEAENEGHSIPGPAAQLAPEGRSPRLSPTQGEDNGEQQEKPQRSEQIGQAEQTEQTQQTEQNEQAQQVDQTEQTEVRSAQVTASSGRANASTRGTVSRRRGRRGGAQGAPRGRGNAQGNRRGGAQRASRGRGHAQANGRGGAQRASRGRGNAQDNGRSSAQGASPRQGLRRARNTAPTPLPVSDRVLRSHKK